MFSHLYEPITLSSSSRSAAREQAAEEIRLCCGAAGRHACPRRLSVMQVAPLHRCRGDVGLGGRPADRREGLHRILGQEAGDEQVTQVRLFHQEAM